MISYTPDAYLLWRQAKGALAWPEQHPVMGARDCEVSEEMHWWR